MCASGNRHGLVQPALCVGDCDFRMLPAEEYAASMAFPGTCRWRGSKRDRLRAAGNAVPCT
ncbi:hypothetical protein [Streptomyces sp. NK15101]|uniref:hypothetical protein n=1 Tax=Streptomyces sp. NK15101 TaxID=2873261 RepID=UPI001CECFDAD|nr:hypothetical protein [Streptomyces sp. NK15101]